MKTAQTTIRVPPYVFDVCRQLRQKNTPAEKILWEVLRNRRLNGFKFRRQHPIGRYIADFFCAEATFIIELDGEIHQQVDQVEYDAMRNETLIAQGFSLIHLPNKLILDHLPLAIEQIIGAMTSLACFPQNGKSE